LLHVVDYTVSEDQQNLVFLVVLIINSRLTPVIYFFQDLAEMSWAIKLNSAQTVHVCFYNSFEALAFWLEYVSIESKAVTCSSMVWLDACSETIGWDLFITIIVLKDISNSFECLQIFVSLKVLAMQRSWCVWLAI
jgi:hypothetical protein